MIKSRHVCLLCLKLLENNHVLRFSVNPDGRVRSTAITIQRGHPFKKKKMELLVTQEVGKET